jgi:hypothetical protein
MMATVIDGTSGSSIAGAGSVVGNLSVGGDLQVGGVTTNLYPLVSDTAKASTSGTSIDFTGIPSWVRRITVMFSGVSTSGTSNILLQIGDAGGIETTSYSSSSFRTTGTAINNASSTAGFLLDGTTGLATYTRSGIVSLCNITGNNWVADGGYEVTAGGYSCTAGSKTLSDTLTQVRITTVNGTDTFDAGTINIMWE